MTKPWPKIKTTPVAKMTGIATRIRGNGRTPIACAALENGYSYPYFRWNVVPVLVKFFDDIKTDGSDIWSETPEQEKAQKAEAALA
jgi:hypothetical protein